MAEISIEREVVIGAPRTLFGVPSPSPDQITQWFAERVEIDLAPGRQGYMGFDKQHGGPIVVEIVDPPSASRSDGILRPERSRHPATSCSSSSPSPPAGRNAPVCGSSRVATNWSRGPTREGTLRRGAQRRLGRLPRSAGRAVRTRPNGMRTEPDLLVRGGEASASSLADQVPFSRQAVSKHLIAVEEVGLIGRRKQGREVRTGRSGPARRSHPGDGRTGQPVGPTTRHHEATGRSSPHRSENSGGSPTEMRQQ
jgi:DNA-binding transcriptional ArsR family regulator